MAGKTRKRRERRHRRQEKAALRFGRKAKPKHRCLSGRTGSAYRKMRASSREVERWKIYRVMVRRDLKN